MPEGAANAGDQANPLRIIRKKAAAGDASAQGRLGLMYETGSEGLAQDCGEALRWYRLAAEQGNAEAQWNLGRLYSEGRGIAQDLAGAAKWFREAALRGHAQAQYKLGNLYRTGTGVPADHGQAVRWYQEGANRGEVLAQNNLGLMLKNGYSAEQDKVRAYMWLHLAAFGYLGAGDEERYTNVIGSRNQLAADMTPEEIAEAVRLAEEWRPNYQQKGPTGEFAKPRDKLTEGNAQVRDAFEGDEEIEARPVAEDRKPKHDREGAPVASGLPSGKRSMDWQRGSAMGSFTKKGEVTMGDGKGRELPKDDDQDLPVMTKMAILCVALGPEAAGEVLKPLGEHEVEEITQAIANLKNVSVA